jgi:hypothetical protein
MDTSQSEYDFVTLNAGGKTKSVTRQQLGAIRVAFLNGTLTIDQRDIIDAILSGQLLQPVNARTSESYYEFTDGPHAGLKIPAEPIDAVFRAAGKDPPEYAEMLSDHAVDDSGVLRQVDPTAPHVVAVGHRVELR